MDISKETFEKEINMCKKLAHENGKKCNWGECDKCGVIPLLYNYTRVSYWKIKEI